MPLSPAAYFMESLDALSKNISALKDEKAIAEESLAILSQALPASAYAVLQMNTLDHHATVVHGIGEWQECNGKKIKLSERFREENESSKEQLPADLRKGSADSRAAFHAIPLAVSHSVWGYAFILFSKNPSSSELRYLHTAFRVVSEAIVRAQLSRRVEGYRQQLELLTTVEHAINNSLTLSVTQNVLLDTCVRILDVDAAALWVMDPQEGKLSMAAKRGFNRTYPLGGYAESEDNLAHRVWGERRQIALAARPEEKNTSRIMRLEKFRYGLAMPLQARGEWKGVLEVYSRSEEAPSREWMILFEKMATQATIAVDHAHMIGAIERASIHLSITCDSTIEAFSRAVDLRTREAEGHGQRVADLTIRMAEKARIPTHQMMHVHRGAMLHDIGKIGVPDSVLWKPGSYNEGDWGWMRQHPQFASDILESVEALKPALAIPQFHHERWDGKGYPYGLAGNTIPLAARLFAVADCWDSMLASRPHRDPIEKMDVMAYINDASGKQFDPEAVQIFLNLLQESEVTRRY